MTGRLAARLLTTFAVIGLCVFTMVRGWNVVAFATAPRKTDPAQFGAPLVATTALTAALDDLAGVSGTDAARRRIELLTQLLSRRPLSSTAWLSLAGMRLVTGAPSQDVLAALKMSSVTGPNEARVMWQRGMFAVLQWETLPADFQQRAIVDLAGPFAWGLVDDGDVRQIEGVLATKTPETQTQLAALLQAQGVDARRLARIGLAPTVTPLKAP